MSHFEFVIPIQRDGLLECDAPGQYTVRHVYEPPEIRASLQDLAVGLSTDGCEFVLEKFDVLYSAITHFSSLKPSEQKQIWEYVNKGYVYLVDNLSAMLESGDLDTETRIKTMNVVKMSTYALCQLAEAFESSQRPGDALAADRGRKGAGRNAGGAAAELDWEAQRLNVLSRLYAVTQLQLRRLWDPPVTDEEFVNVIGNVCYRFLESPAVGHVRSKPLRDGIFQVLGTLVRSYNHSLSCSLKIIQMLQQYEHMPAPLASGVVTMATDFQARSLMNDIVRELASLDATELAKDGSATKHYAEFLSLVASQLPDLVLNNMFLLVKHLDEESHLMRNAVLSMLGDLVSLVLRGEELDDKQRRLRDQYLDNLEDHVHDVHAFVRTKVLQIWRKLCTDGAVPLARQRSVLQLAVGRLQDKSSNVRKAAIQLITTFLQANPFAAKLPVAELEQQYRTEKAKLLELGVTEEEADGDAGEDEDVAEDQADDDGDPTLALQRASAWLTAALQAAVSGDYEPDMRDRRRKLLEMLEADRSTDAMEEMMSDPHLIPGYSKHQQPPAEGSQESADTPEGSDRSISLDRLVALLNAMRQDATSSDPARQVAIAKQKMMVLYFRDSVEFARLIDQAMPAICSFLCSAQSTDILEAISFFVTAFEFGLLKAMIGIRQMLGLIWSKEANIKEAVVEAYKRLYISAGGTGRGRAGQVVTNLSALCADASVAELAALEQLVVQLVRSGDIDSTCVQLMWERFTRAAPDTSQDTARAALLLIGMCAGAEPDIVSANLDVLADFGLKPYTDGTELDFRMVQYTCNALLKIAPRKPKPDDKNPPKRLGAEHSPMFSQLCDILVNSVRCTEDVHYTPMAQLAVDAIYQLSDQPDPLVEALLRRMDALMEGASPAAQARWLFVVGHVVLNQMIFLDTHVFTELKRRNRIREEAAGQKQLSVSHRSHAHVNVTTGTPDSASATPLNRRRSQEGEPDEEGLTGAVADDAEAEYITELLETGTVCGSGLLASYLPLLVEVNSYPERYRHRDLRTAAATALAKYMLVSSRVCDDHLQLLFTVLERSPDDVIRSNIIVALGDLSSRFPNLVEPWTPSIYARLSDKSVRVRKTTLTVLTRLILNDMVKVKGQISDVAERIVDPEETVREMAKAFFTELSQKGNALYNWSTDIISRLSDPEVGISEDNFQTVMRYILGLIQKDRQLESLVEKLCHRFRAASTGRQWRSLAFCLSLLNVNDRAVRKLLENFSCFGDKLQERDVYDSLMKVVATAKKAAKSNEARATVDELEARLTETHQKAVEDENVASNAAGRAAGGRLTAERGEDGEEEQPDQDRARSVRKKKADLTPRRSALNPGKAQRRRRRVSSSEEEGSDPDSDTGAEPELEAPLPPPPPPAPAPPQSGRSTRSRRLHNPAAV